MSQFRTSTSLNSMKMYRFVIFLMAMTIVFAQDTVNITARDIDGNLIELVTPGRNITLTCTYTIVPRYAEFYNGHKFMASYDFRTNNGHVGGHFKGILTTPYTGQGWMSADLNVPYCSDGVFKCNIFDTSINRYADVMFLIIGVITDPKISGTGEVDKPMEDPNNFELECSVYGVGPQANFTWSKGCNATSPPSTDEDTSRCLFNQSSKAECSWINLPKNGEVYCTVFSHIGLRNGSITITQTNINMTATDDEGEPTNIMTPDSTMTFNCSFGHDPQFVTLYNSTEDFMYKYDFIKGQGFIGEGFNDMVQGQNVNKGLLSVDLKIPYCYNDDMIKCTVIDVNGVKYEAFQDFHFGVITDPKISSPAEIDPPMEDPNNFELECSVYGVGPQANFTWSKGCNATSPPSTDEDTSRCLFNQSSKVECSWINLPKNGEVYCTVISHIGLRNGTITITQRTTDGQGGLEKWEIALLTVGSVAGAGTIGFSLCKVCDRGRTVGFSFAAASKSRKKSSSEGVYRQTSDGITSLNNNTPSQGVLDNERPFNLAVRS